jgi:hypothetical protein
MADDAMPDDVVMNPGDYAYVPSDARAAYGGGITPGDALMPAYRALPVRPQPDQDISQRDSRVGDAVYRSVGGGLRGRAIPNAPPGAPTLPLSSNQT